MGLILLLIYSLLAPVIAFLYAVFFLLSPRRALMKNLAGELGERLAISPAFFTTPPLWIHAASLGEVKAVSKLAPELAAALNAPLLFTASTASGRAEAARLLPADGCARLIPLDFYPLAARFIARNRPRMLVVVETEIWPALFYAAARAGVPVFLVNARISTSTFTLYRLLSPLTRLVFSGVSCVLAQSAQDAGRFSMLPGLEGKVTVTGNLKHDLLGTSGADAQKAADVIKATGWADSPVFTAGSTHPAEEPLLIAAYLEAKKNVGNLKLILVPRHSERAGETEAALRAQNVSFARWSAGIAAGTDCLLIDTAGLLQAFYCASTICFVGGTLDNTGGHNLLEPALFLKPVIFGPNFRNARLAGNALLKEKGGFVAATAADIAAILRSLLGDSLYLRASAENAGRALASLKGATQATIAALSAAPAGRN